jgi:transposase InsO family protein
MENVRAAWKSARAGTMAVWPGFDTACLQAARELKKWMTTNEHWFPSLLHARAQIERWRREYNEERPKKALGGLTSAAYAKQLK